MIKWAKGLLTRNDWIILDTETTGLGYHDQIVSIGVLSPTGEILLDTLVKPTIPIPADATAIHGITDQDVANAPGFDQIYQQLIDLAKDKLVVVYNADYDYRMVEQSAAAVLGEGLMSMVNSYAVQVGMGWACAMDMYAEFYGDWSEYHGSYRWQKLTSACRQQGVKVERAHRAIGDCQLTLALIKAVAQSEEERSF